MTLVAVGMLFSGIAPALRPENTQQRAPGSQQIASSHRRACTQPCCALSHWAWLLQRWRGNQVSRHAHAACYTTRVACRAIRPRIRDKAEPARHSMLAARVRKYSPSPHVVCWHAAKQRLASPSSFRPSVWCPRLPDPSLPARLRCQSPPQRLRARARYGELWVTPARGPLTCSRLALAKWR
jgi:hypothetical protein